MPGIEELTNIVPASFLGFIGLRVPYATKRKQCIERIVAGIHAVSDAARHRVAPPYRGNCEIHPRCIVQGSRETSAKSIRRRRVLTLRGAAISP